MNLDNFFKELETIEKELKDSFKETCEKNGIEYEDGMEKCIAVYKPELNEIIYFKKDLFGFVSTPHEQALIPIEPIKRNNFLKYFMRELDKLTP